MVMLTTTEIGYSPCLHVSRFHDLRKEWVAKYDCEHVSLGTDILYRGATTYCRGIDRECSASRGQDIRRCPPIWSGSEGIRGERSRMS